MHTACHATIDLKFRNCTALLTSSLSLEKGRGGLAAIKVANVRGTTVAAKCFYQQILVSPYNLQLFNQEMNMAACLCHPNLVQFIGSSLKGEPLS